MCDQADQIQVPELGTWAQSKQGPSSRVRMSTWLLQARWQAEMMMNEFSILVLCYIRVGALQLQDKLGFWG